MTEKLTLDQKRCQSRCQILETLLALDVASKQGLHKELAKKMSRATLSKRVDELKNEGLVNIEKGSRGPVGTHNCSLEFKGLVYLVLECNLEGERLEKALMKLFSNKKFNVFRPLMHTHKDRVLLSQVVAKSISELRFKINLQHFDQDWALLLFFRLLEEALWERFKELRVNTLDDVRKLLKSTGIKKRDLIEFYKAELEAAKSIRKEGESKIGVYKALIKIAQKIR